MALLAVSGCSSRSGRPAKIATGYISTETPTANLGYGAGWWINQGESRGARFRRKQGMPADFFMALGIYGQTVVVVPSERLVIARFGTTYDQRQAVIDICRLTANTVTAVRGVASAESSAGAPRVSNSSR